MIPQARFFFTFLLSTLSFLFAGWHSNLYAQEHCDCRQALERLVTRIESDYPGFAEKTKDHELYMHHKHDLLSRSSTASNDSCSTLLQAYTAYFRDEHIFLQKTNSAGSTAEKDASAPEQKPVLEARLLDANIFYLKMSSFSYEYTGPLAALIQQHASEIRHARALIIDVRDNFGGTDDVYQPLLPYILTQPLRIMNVEFLSTPTLINGLRDYALQQLDRDADSAAAIAKIEEGLKDYRDNPGQFVLFGGRKVSIDTIPLLPESPGQVVILSNHNVASAGENFLFSARQSKKVKILGTPSMGVLDYGSIRIFKFGCDNYELYLPTYRSARLPQYPVDNIGIQPDVYLDETVEDWLAFAIRYILE